MQGTAISRLVRYLNIAFFQFFLILASPCGQGEAEYEIQDAAHQEWRAVDAGTCCGPVVGAVHEVCAAYEGNNRGVLDKVHHLVDQRRHDDFDSLGQDNPAHGLDVGKALGRCRLCLAMRYGFNAGADHFGYIGTVINADGVDADGNLSHIKADIGKSQIKDVGLKNQGGILQGFHIASGYEPWYGVCRCGHDTEHYPQGQGQQKGQNGDHDSYAKGLSE